MHVVHRRILAKNTTHLGVLLPLFLFPLPLLLEHLPLALLTPAERLLLLTHALIAQVELTFELAASLVCLQSTEERTKGKE